MVFQLAAESSTRHEAIFQNHAAIATGTLNVLEAVRKHAPDARVFVTGSGLQFKNSGVPIDEGNPFEARDAYSVARIHAAYCARYYRTLGVRSFVGYLFHHDSPARPSRHLARMVAECATRIARGSAERLPIGQLDTQREWGFSRDIAEGMITLISQDRVAEAVIGTGRGHSIREWISLCFAHVGLAWQEYVDPNPSFHVAFQRLVSNPATMRALGWEASTTIEQMARLMMDSAA